MSHWYDGLRSEVRKCKTDLAAAVLIQDRLRCQEVKSQAHKKDRSTKADREERLFRAMDEEKETWERRS